VLKAARVGRGTSNRHNKHRLIAFRPTHLRIRDARMYTCIRLHDNCHANVYRITRHVQEYAAMWSRSRHLGLETVSRRTKCLVSVLFPQKFTTYWSRLGLGYLRLVPKTLFCPNFARHINKLSQISSRAVLTRIGNISVLLTDGSFRLSHSARKCRTVVRVVPISIENGTFGGPAAQKPLNRST